MDMRICSECGHEYDALQPHECYFSQADILREKAQHGGRRPGAGRPPVSDGKTMRVTITMTPNHFHVAQQLGDGNVSAGVRIIADNWLSYNQPLVKRVELWQHRTSGERYAVVTEGGVCVDASGPLNQADVDAIMAGSEDVEWSGELSDDIAEHDEEYRRIWPDESA